MITAHKDNNSNITECTENNMKITNHNKKKGLAAELGVRNKLDVRPVKIFLQRLRTQ